MIFRGDAPTFSERPRALISIMGDWYVGEYFSYICVWGRNTVHLLMRIGPDRMVLQEIDFQTIVDGVFLKLAAAKRKCCCKFPLYLGFLALHNSPHASILGKSIEEMNLGEAPKRMHDPKSLLEYHFV